MEIFLSLSLSLSLSTHTHTHTQRLTAEDVMNPDLKYLYPITRVSSIVSQLRTTAHSAFLVVTQVSLDQVHQKPQTMARHTPQLYSTKRTSRERAFSADSGTYYKNAMHCWLAICSVYHSQLWRCKTVQNYAH